MRREIVRIITFGLGGHGMEIVHPDSKFSPKSSLSGYDRPETFKFERYEKYEIPDGTPVLDKRVPLAENPRLSLNSPLVDPLLPPGSYEEAPEPSEFMLAGLEGAFQALAVMAKTRKTTGFTGLDSVDVETFVEWWRERGARVGKVVDRAFVWEN